MSLERLARTLLLLVATLGPAREAAAQSFAASKLPAESAAERLSAAAHLRSAGRYRTALELLATATEEAIQAGRPDLHARIMGQAGSVRARMGQSTEGLALVQRGLALALEHNLASAAAEIYQRLADALEHAVGPTEQIVVRLDDGQAFTILQNTLEHFEPGERVLLSPSKFGTRLEHAPH